MYNRRHLGGLNLKAIVLKCKNFLRFDLVTYFLTQHDPYELCLDIAKTNILTKFHQNQVTNVASRVKTRLSKDLTW